MYTKQPQQLSSSRPLVDAPHQAAQAAIILIFHIFRNAQAMLVHAVAPWTATQSMHGCGCPSAIISTEKQKYERWLCYEQKNLTLAFFPE
jgi:hypothetical protein